MARRKSRKSPRLTTVIWTLVATVSSGGIGGYLKSDLPVLGPLVQRFISDEEEKLAGAFPAPSANGYPAATATNNPGYAQGYPPPGIDPRAIPTSANPARRYPPANPQAGTNYVQPTSAAMRPAPVQQAASRKPSDRLLIATFNIQVFGESKLGKPEVVEVLAAVVRQFDIVAIQEVRAKADNILPDFVSAINADGSRYSFLIGPRLGRSNSKEQYAYIFDTNRIEHDPQAVGTMQDPNDLLHREPFVARFRARTASPQHAFTFWLVDTHTDPDEVPEEVAALADVFRVMQTARADEDDVILLGDLNASEKQLGPLGQIPGITWVVRNAMTNTRQNKAYDNILFHAQATQEFTGRWGVFDLERAFGLSREQALDVSDHLPVWAEFQIWEAPHQARVAEAAPAMQR
ncbi:endonuclease/exonuclease/phosphatase family protein [Rosistilla oblonga]|uniref:Endonuclease/Exonuclease/phosphatase family protein n=1 Tax=Rosistilla oblonga TaxID=2527990 RepID=A0A518IW79_9BACT|nr:endonuclease/exonuclease/phosphatase family protein [Rosistilla oblonga]QDV57337.1 Endonuclease/Exonuclease/phosphatase family protein [Rosistilla oblonga]